MFHAEGDELADEFLISRGVIDEPDLPGKSSFRENTAAENARLDLAFHGKGGKNGNARSCLKQLFECLQRARLGDPVRLGFRKTFFPDVSWMMSLIWR